MTTWSKLDLTSTISSALSILIVCWLLFFSSHGYDFTDEGFYLNWISNPQQFKYSVTQFGFVYHPLYLISEGNIAVLRQINILMTAGLAAIAGFYCIKSLTRESITIGTTFTLTTGFSAASLSLFSQWLLTPNYNTLAFQSLLITSTGLFIIGMSREEPQCTTKIMRTAGPALIGIGGGLAFLAKPTTALMLALLAAVYLAVVNPKRSLWAGAGALLSATIFLLIAAILIDGSPLLFVHRLTKGSELAALLGGGHGVGGLLRIDPFSPDFKTKSLCVGVAVTTAAASFGAGSANSKINHTAKLLLFALFFAAFFMIFASPWVTLQPQNLQGMTMVAVPAALFTVCFFSIRKEKLREVASLSIGNSLLCFGLPLAFAFGTNNNIWKQASYASFFWILGGLSLLPLLKTEKTIHARLVPAIAATQLLAVFLLNIGMANPYRQTKKIQHQNSKITLGTGHNFIRVTPRSAAFIKLARDIGRQSGFTEGTPILDLTGKNPGLIFAMNAEVVGQPWNIGGYPGSFRLAQESIRFWSCNDLSRTWLLREPTGPRGISATLLHTWGVELEHHYEIAGTWSIPPISDANQKKQIYVLHKPKNQPSDMLKVCLKHRGMKAS